MSDVLVKLLAKEAGLRGLACITTELSREGARRHKTSRTATAAIAQGLTGVALMGGALLKVKQRLAMKFDGDGPLGKLIVEADSYGRVRGYVSDGTVEHPSGEVAQLIGRGALVVTKDIGLSDIMESSVPLTDGEIDADLSLYLERSEQIASAVEVGVRLGTSKKPEEMIEAAGGILIQAMPGHDEQLVAHFKNRLQELPPIADMLFDGTHPEAVLKQLFAGTPHDILEHRDLSFVCGCNYARSEQALIALGLSGLDELIEEGEAVVNCHFCHEEYLFTQSDLIEVRSLLL